MPSSSACRDILPFSTDQIQKSCKNKRLRKPGSTRNNLNRARFCMWSQKRRVTWKPPRIFRKKSAMSTSQRSSLTFGSVMNVFKRRKGPWFDDLLLKAALLLRQKPEILEHYQNTWKYIHIDEYQDTNKVQYDMARLLARKNKNICVVATLIKWSTHGEALILKISSILKKIIQKQALFFSKRTIVRPKPFSRRQIEPLPRTKIAERRIFSRKMTMASRSEYSTPMDEADEADFIAGKSSELIKQGISPKEIAVLYRANFQSRALEEAFLTS